MGYLDKNFGNPQLGYHSFEFVQACSVKVFADGFLNLTCGTAGSLIMQLGEARNGECSVGATLLRYSIFS